MDLDDMIFSMGSTFIFRSWIYEADDKGKLQGCLLKDQENQEDLTLLARSTKELIGRLSRLIMSKSVLVSPMIEFNSDSRTGSDSKPIQILFMVDLVLFRWDSGTWLQFIKRSTQAYFRMIP
jgi:hypothetical protein